MTRLRKRTFILTILGLCVVAPAVVVGVHVARTERPEFHEEAWAEAVRVLEEEVGPAAVASGAVDIPKVEIAVNDGDAALVWRCLAEPVLMTLGRLTEHWTCMLLDGDGGLVVDKDTRNDPLAARTEDGVRIAEVDRAEGRHMLRVLAYLAEAESAAPASTGKQPSMPLGDPREWIPKTFTTYSGGGKWMLYGAPYPSSLKARLMKRYLSSARIRGILRPPRDEEEGARTACRMLASLAHNAGGRGTSLQKEAIDVLKVHPSMSAAPALLRFRRLEDRARSWRKVSEVPVIGRLVKRWGLDGPLDGISSWPDRMLAALEELSSKTADERIAAATKAGQAGQDNGQILEYLLPRAPRRDCPKALSDLLDSMGPADKAAAVRRAYSYYLTGPELAQRAAGEKEPIVACTGEWVLFLLTRDRAHLARCVELLPEWERMAQHDGERQLLRWDVLCSWLAAAYAADPTLEEIGAAFERKLRDMPLDAGVREWGSMTPVISAEKMATALLSDDRVENNDAVLRLLSSRAAEDVATFAIGMATMQRGRSALSAALAGTRDGRFADAMVRHLAAREEGFDTRLDELYLEALSARGDQRVTAIVERALAGMGDAALRDSSGWLTPAGRLTRAALEVRLRSAVDPVSAFAESTADERNVAASAAADVLAARLTQDDLQRLLADPSNAAMQEVLYMALVRHRPADAPK